MLKKSIALMLCCMCMLSAFSRTASASRHVVVDAPTLSIQNLQLAQEVVGQVLKLSSFIEEVQTYISLGTQAVSKSKGLIDKAQSKANELVKTVTVVSVSDGLKDLGLDTAMEDVSSMTTVMQDKILPSLKDNMPQEGETVEELLDRKFQYRKMLAVDAYSDAYAAATTFMQDSTKTVPETIASAQNSASSGETLIAKQDSANEIAAAQLLELQKSNNIQAQMLRLMAADMIGSMPKTNPSFMSSQGQQSN